MLTYSQGPSYPTGLPGPGPGPQASGAQTAPSLFFSSREISVTNCSVSLIQRTTAPTLETPLHGHPSVYRARVFKHVDTALYVIPEFGARGPRANACMEQNIVTVLPEMVQGHPNGNINW